MTQLSANELRKYSERADIFVRKIKENELFEVVGNKKVKIIAPQKSLAVLKSGSDTELRDLRLADTDGNIYKLTDFVKNKDFGGRGAGSGTAKEDKALTSLRYQINKAKSAEGRATIKIQIGSKTYDVFDVVSTPGTPKSDFHLINIDGESVAWISHKDGSTAKDFQQWGGMSTSKEPKLATHKESTKFIDDLKAYCKAKGLTGLPRATTVARKISDKKLKMLSIYGNAYGSIYNTQNVTLVLQGDIILNKTNSTYNITATHTHLNGEELNNDYEPVLMAIYKGDRSDYGVTGTRIVIAPVGSRKITEYI